MTKKKALGRGLGALIPDTDQGPDQAGFPLEVSVEAIDPNPFQPRERIDIQELKPLVESIRDRGVLEPLLVRRLGPDRYQLIAGERRLRAAKSAGLAMVPVVIRAAEEPESLELALIENLHRQDLNPIEEAESYRILQERYGRSQEELVRLSGKDRSTVANLIRLLGLPEPVKEDVRQGRLSAGHVRALLGLADPGRILAAREQVLSRSLSVRETENLVKRHLKKASGKEKRGRGDEAYYQDLSERIARVLGAKVKIVHQGRRSRIEIPFSSAGELERLMKALGAWTA